MKYLRERGGTDGGRQSKHALIQIGTHDFGNSGSQAASCLKARRAGELRGDGGRIVVSKIAEGVRVDADAAARSNDCFFVQPVSNSQARRELTDADVVAASIHLVGSWIVPLAFKMVAFRRRVSLVPNAIIDGELAVNLPQVAYIQPIGRHTDRGRVFVLHVLAHGLRQTEQEVRPTVVQSRRRTALQRRQSAREI